MHFSLNEPQFFRATSPLVYVYLFSLLGTRKYINSTWQTLRIYYNRHSAFEMS